MIRFRLPDLEVDGLRDHMVAEAVDDRQAGRLHISPLLKPGSDAEYFSILRDAVQSGTPGTLSRKLNVHGVIRGSGDTGVWSFPINAPDLLAWSGFRRYYMRAVCLTAIDRRKRRVEVYEAYDRSGHDAAAERLLGKKYEAREVLAILRGTSVGEPSKTGTVADLSDSESHLCIKLY